MKVGEVELAFPVLGFTTDRDIWGFPGMNELTRCGPRTLKDNMQEGMVLVDADGRSYRVLSVRRTGAAPLQSWLHVFSPRESRIEQELEPLPPVSLDEAKAKVCEGIDAFPLFWAEDLPTLKADVRAARSFAAMHDRLGLDWFSAY